MFNVTGDGDTTAGGDASTGAETTGTMTTTAGPTTADATSSDGSASASSTTDASTTDASTGVEGSTGPGMAILVVAPTPSHDFGDVDWGGTAPQNFTITNTGDAEATALLTKNYRSGWDLPI